MLLNKNILIDNFGGDQKVYILGLQNRKSLKMHLKFKNKLRKTNSANMYYITIDIFTGCPNVLIKPIDLPAVMKHKHSVKKSITERFLTFGHEWTKNIPNYRTLFTSSSMINF